MSYQQIILLLVGLSLLAWYLGRNRAIQSVNEQTLKLNSLPVHYGLYAAIWAFVPAFLFLIFWIACQNTITTKLLLSQDYFHGMSANEQNLALNTIANLASGALNADNADPNLVGAAAYLNSVKNTTKWAGISVALILSVAGALLALKRIAPKMRARTKVETFVKYALMTCSTIAILTTIGIVLSVLFESIRFFQKVSPIEFFTSTHWSAQTAIREDQVGSSGSFGAIPLFTGTLLISTIAMMVAAPIGLLSAIYLAEYASRNVRNIVKPIIEILAGIPTVVYGFFAALTVAPFIRNFSESVGLEASSESALAAGLVMGIMIVPFVSSISDDVITAVPKSLRDGAYGLGSTKSETIKSVIIPAALPGIVGGLLLAISRAIGETMIVVMAAGLAANLTANPLEAVTTVTVQIVTLLVGDQEFDSAKTLAAFALGLVLFLITLLLNIIALVVVRKYREQYD